jgi:hypothetical protein
MRTTMFLSRERGIVSRVVLPPPPEPSDGIFAEVE